MCKRQPHNTPVSFRREFILVLGIGLAWIIPRAEAQLQSGAELLQESGITGGLVVSLGHTDPTRLTQLHAGGQFRVHALDLDPTRVQAARQELLAQGRYGPISVDRWDGVHLPYADNLINLIVATEPEQVSQTELLRVLAPRGVVLFENEKRKRWQKMVKPWPTDMDEWTHYFHSANGNPVAQDRQVGPPTQLQWIGSPRWSRHHDHAASMSALVSAQGRLFYIFDEGPTASIQLPSNWQLIARDAFNGHILWKRAIDEWNTRQYPLKSGPAHLLRRLVAVDQQVFVTLGIDAPVSVLDAATGKTSRTFTGSKFTREIVVSDGLALLVADNDRSQLPDWQRLDSFVWANTRRANPDWGWQGTARNILAYDIDSGQMLWQVKATVAPCSLATDKDYLCYHDGEKLICRKRQDGTLLWHSQPSPVKIPVHTNTGPRVLIYQDTVLLAGNNGKMSGWSLSDGEKLWEQNHHPSGHLSLKDLFVVDGIAWTGKIAQSSNDGTFTGYDPDTGAIVKTIPADVKVNWFHHRCYPSKATPKYLITARNGTEFIDLDAQHWTPHHWVRGGCIYGVMPCNGLIYAPMDSCGCQLEAKLSGFKALASGPIPPQALNRLNTQDDLEKGPAYQSVVGPSAAPTDWPTYRYDNQRSGASPAPVTTNLKQNWSTNLGGRLSAPTIAADLLFVASIDTHTLHALNAHTGERIWSYTTGARIDSPPTYFQGYILFGSADGCIYALRAIDGVLAWRLRGVPLDRRIMAWEQLESTWRIHGSVLVQNDVLYCTAGRNMYLNGGMRFLRLNPRTGELLSETIMNERDPETGQDMHLAYVKKVQGNNMPVAHSDILSCDGQHIWMRSQKITFAGRRVEIALQNVTEQNNDDFHIFCQNGFLDDSYFFRSYWTFGRRVGGGYGSWLKAGRLVPSGRILCFDRGGVYGFGRKPEYMTNASVCEYQLFAANRTVSAAAIQDLNKSEKTINAHSAEKNANASDWRLRSFFPTKDLTSVNFQWQLDQPAVLARAMCVAGDTLFVAGPVDLLDERFAFHYPNDPELQTRLIQQAEALAGQRGGELWAVSKSDGSVIKRYALDTIPVFDGMAAAGNKLYLATTNGQMLCLASSGRLPLQQVTQRPLRIAWDHPEDPNYLVTP